MSQNEIVLSVVVAALAITVVVLFVLWLRKGRKKEEVEAPEQTPQTALEKVLAKQRNGGEGLGAVVSSVSPLQKEQQELEMFFGIADDERAKGELYVSQQLLRASEARVDAQVNNLYIAFNQQAAVSYKGLVAQMKMANLRRMMKTMPVGGVAVAMQELQNLMAELSGAAAARQVEAAGVQQADPRALTPGQPAAVERTFRLTINGQPVGGGQAVVNIPGGYIEINPAPGPQGYEEGTEVTLVAHPSEKVNRVYWQRGARVVEVLRAVATMSGDRDVRVAITPIQPVRTGQAHRTAGAGAAPRQPAPTSRAEQLLEEANRRGF